jgi:hypothetical protein
MSKLIVELRNKIYKNVIKERSEVCREMKSINAIPCLARLPENASQSKKPSLPQFPNTHDVVLYTLHLLPMSLYRHLDIHSISRG